MSKYDSKLIKLRLTAGFIMLAVFVSLLSSCSFFSPITAENMIICAGSTSVQPYAELLAEAFMNKPDNRGKQIDIEGGGSSTGIKAAETGAADIGMSSRELKDAEAEVLTYVFELAKDGLAIIIHPDNPISDLTIEQIRKIYTQEIKTWNELGWPSGKTRKIHIITREDGSGTRTAFQDLVMTDADKNKHEISPRAIVQSANGAVRLLVSDDPNAIGFISLGLVKAQKGQKEVKALVLNGAAATPDNVSNGTYPLSRPFLLVAKSEPTELTLAKEFIDFVCTDEAKQMMESEGLIPVCKVR